jgi:predicted hydrocarbon binding protein
MADETEGYQPIDTKKKGAISEFFYHMISYGGFSFEDGVMRVWGDPSLFTPAKSFVLYYRFLRDEIGKDADDLFYWIGRLYGRNSSVMLMKKFGFNPKKLPDFINGATQDGFGYIEVSPRFLISDKVVDGDITGVNSTFALRYKDMFGPQKDPVDFYMLGLLTGGSEPLFNRPFDGVERRCMVQDGPDCLYQVASAQSPPKFPFFARLKENEADIIEATRNMTMNRKSSFKILGKKDISFGDGSFILKGYTGFNLASYAVAILDMFSLELLGKEKFSSVKDKVAESFVQETFDERLKSKLVGAAGVSKILEKLSLFGFGKMELVRIFGSEILIKNTNNPYASDMKDIFGRLDEASFDNLRRILHFAFNSYFIGSSFGVSMGNVSLKEAYFKVRPS